MMMTGKQLNSTKLYLPIFLASRTRIKKYNFSVVRNYILKNTRNYSVPCVEGTDEENEDSQKSEHSSNENGKLKLTSSSPSKSKTTKNRYRRSEQSWHLAPNRYNIPNEIGCSKNGIQWSRSKKPTASLKKDSKPKTQRTFYEISTNYFEKSKNICNRHKGKFSTDPRNRRPTSRFMINNPVTCWRNQNDPGPTSYFIAIFERSSFQKIVNKHIAPYKFLRYSCVPENLRLRILGKSSFSPGPGRYELLDDEQSLRIRLRIQMQKRFKFRRLHLKRINLPKQKLYSERRHIFGYGFTRLFRDSIKSSKKVDLPRKTHRTGHEVRMFPSFEYIKMITNPDRSTFSMRTQDEFLEKSNSLLRFNCLVKVHKRRQLRDNKKVVFGSGVPRFKDSDIQIVRNQPKPPPLLNFPIMTINFENIKTKFDTLPERLRGTNKTSRMQPFKFQPIPPVKLLLNEKEVHPESAENLEVYPKELNPVNFF